LSILLTKILIVCGLLLLTSIKMDIVNIDIDKNIDRVRSANSEVVV